MSPGQRNRAGVERDEACNVGLRQPAEDHAVRHLFTRQLRERRRKWVANGWVDVAIRADDEYAAAAELAGDEAQEEQRGLVCSVQVVQDEDERAYGCCALEEPRRSVEEPAVAPSSSSDGSGRSGSSSCSPA